MSANGNLEEVGSNPANVYHTTQLSDAMKTTGDIDKVNAHGNSVDVTASHNNFTANSGNQTVTDSLTHETLVKTISVCGSDYTRGNRVNLSSMNDVQFDISSTEQSGSDVKSVSKTVSQDEEQSLSPGTVHLKTKTPTFPLLAPRSLYNVSESRTKPESNAVDRNALPALKLPKLSSFESRKLSPVSPKTFSMKSSSSLKSADLPKIRNKRSESGTIYRGSPKGFTWTWDKTKHHQRRICTGCGCSEDWSNRKKCTHKVCTQVLIFMHFRSFTFL